MKIRNGFVSNSSSASFIVSFVNYDRITKISKYILTKDEYNRLLGFGFKLTCKRDPFNNGISCNDCKDKYNNLCWGKIFKDTMVLRKDVICNEDEVIQFLLHYDIPFIASIHYDNELKVYKRGFDKVLSLQNEGIGYLYSCCSNIPEKDYFDPESYSMKSSRFNTRKLHDKSNWFDSNTSLSEYDYNILPIGKHGEELCKCCSWNYLKLDNNKCKFKEKFIERSKWYYCNDEIECKAWHPHKPSAYNGV